jgi:hypothetical protein
MGRPEPNIMPMSAMSRGDFEIFSRIPMIVGALPSEFSS